VLQSRKRVFLLTGSLPSWINYVGTYGKETVRKKNTIYEEQKRRTILGSRPPRGREWKEVENGAINPAGNAGEGGEVYPRPKWETNREKSRLWSVKVMAGVINGLRNAKISGYWVPYRKRKGQKDFRGPYYWREGGGRSARTLEETRTREMTRCKGHFWQNGGGVLWCPLLLRRVSSKRTRKLDRSSRSKFQKGKWTQRFAPAWEGLQTLRKAGSIPSLEWVA